MHLELQEPGHRPKQLPISDLLAVSPHLAELLISGGTLATSLQGDIGPKVRRGCGSN